MKTTKGLVLRWRSCSLTLLLMISCFSLYGKDPAPANLNRTAVNAAIAEFEPALAVRASGCITCHADIRPSYITDFGYGSRYFFGRPGQSGKFGSFNGSVYGDFFGDPRYPDTTGFMSAHVEKSVIVPVAPLDFDLGAAGGRIVDQPVYRQPLRATSLAGYLRGLEQRKSAPAAIIEKQRVFIGAPDSETLLARFKVPPGSTSLLEYVKNEPSSPEIAGIGIENGKQYYTNTGEVVCDGDLLVQGTLFLDRVILSTKNGCRIYATGPIFMQNAIVYKTDPVIPDRANLQLVSSQAILMGVGDKSCETSDKESPLSRRLVSGYAVSTYLTREADRKSIAPETLGKSIYAEGKRIPSLEDATCQADAPEFSRLLLNAPLVHSRYQGRFKGLVIAEVVLFRLGKSHFAFDPVFKEVPTLPLLKDADYLEVE
ncbi:MAG: hypothetical protein GXY47_00415 [Acidobacteria bacterium]|nr:hypothetical protein [Acidobacteriota bacterium]